MSTEHDTKKQPLLSEEEDAPAPPSYAASAATPTVGDGNIFSDLPRPGQMDYRAGQAEPYTSRSERSTWSTSILGCFSEPTSCLKAFCCPCISYGQTRHRLQYPNSTVPAPLTNTACLGYGLAATCIPGSQFIFGMLQRNELRRKLGIEQPVEDAGVGFGGRERDTSETWRVNALHAVGALEDAMMHFFCQPCALAQEEREVVRWEEEGKRGVVLGDEEEGRLLRRED